MTDIKDAAMGLAAFPPDEYRRRYEVVQAGLRRDGLDLLLVTGPENITYLTGYESIGYSSFQVGVVPAGDTPRLFVRELERAAARGLSWIAREPDCYSDDEDPADRLVVLLRELGASTARVGVDLSSQWLPARTFLCLRSRLPDADFVDGSAHVEEARLIKSDLEIECIRQAANYTRTGMIAATQAIAEGVVDNEISAVAAAAMLRAGSEYLTIDPIVTTGSRSGIGHTTFARQRIEGGDAVLLEMSGIHKRYAAGLMRSAVVGQPSSLITRMYDACCRGLEGAIQIIRPGVPSSDVHAACQKVINNAGFEPNFRKRLGYSVGVAFPPDWGEGHIFQLSAEERRELRPGMVFHMPPALREFGVAGVGCSETVLVTDTGVEVITDFSRDLVVA